MTTGADETASSTRSSRPWGPRVATLGGVSMLAMLLAAGGALAHTSQVEADPQISADGSVVLEGVFSVVDGWAVLHEVNETGEPGAALANVSVDGDAGFRTDIRLDLPAETWRAWGPARPLIAAMHRDDGDGRFDAEEDPIVESFGHRVTSRFTVANGSEPGWVSALGFGPQNLTGDEVRIRAAVLPAAGHLVVSTNRTVDPGARLGAVALDEGTHHNVTVPIDAARLEPGTTRSLYAQLFRDDGDGALDAEDRPVQAGQEIVQTRFVVERPSPSQAPAGNATNATEASNATNGTGTGGSPSGRSTATVGLVLAVAATAGAAILARRS